MFFDARAAKLLQPGRHLLLDGCPGLRLEASTTRRSWTYRYKDLNGRMKQVGIGQWPVMSVQEAVGKWRVLSAERAAGVDLVGAKREARQVLVRAGESDACEVPTVRSVVMDYALGPLTQTRSEKGATAAKRALLRLLNEDPEFAAMPALHLKRDKAFAVIDGRKAYPAAAAKLRSLMGAAWEYAQDKGDLPETPNWWREVLRGKLRSKGKIIGGEHVGRQRRVLPVPEVTSLLGWLPNMHDLARDGVLMYLWTATRGVEIFGAKPEHLRHDGKVLWWTIPKRSTKNARFADSVDLRVPLFGRAREVMERRKAHAGASGLLFEDARGEQYTQHDFSTYVYDLQPYSIKSKARPGRPVLPVSGWTPHHLRKTARTFLAQLGCVHEIAEAIMGHLPTQIVDTYNAYTYDAERIYWLRKLSDFLEGLVPADSGLPALP